MSRRLDLLSLIAGLVFILAGAAQLLGVNLVSTSLWRAWPLLLVLAGIAALLGRSRTPDE
jgi:hypothetical protein